MKNYSIPFSTNGPYPVREGNRLLPLIDGEPAFRRICEAIEAAENSVWVTITFLWASFEMPDGRGSVFDVLDLAAVRGVDVRLICWRPDDETSWLRDNAFWGAAEHFELLNGRLSGVKIRWDRAQPGFCQHQKSWLVDGTAFVGGINLNPHSVVMPGHLGAGQNHDVYVEIQGPAVIDVQHNFVQRWNGASERLERDGCWGKGSETDLSFPDRVPGACGQVTIQLQRTMPGGERANFEQYVAAINAAGRTVYMENQHVDVPEIIDSLHRALQRGVTIVLLMPAAPNNALRPLRKFGNFILAGIAGLSADGRRQPVHVHAKVMLIDDEWGTAGSCNLHHFSLFGNSELNAAFYDPATVRAFRSNLFLEHLGLDTSDMDDRTALQLFRRIAKENRVRSDVHDYQWQGIAYDQH
ncbi:phospholipase D-like domain-containing protein [Mucilaginibacter lappiensis]|uniref:phospholipase D-like domain-containing protein n=1 Tax=Mucilaginibacter lappiensis TaxID=354630 RepID=UPI003D24FBD9